METLNAQYGIPQKVVAQIAFDTLQWTAEEMPRRVKKCAGAQDWINGQTMRFRLESEVEGIAVKCNVAPAPAPDLRPVVMICVAVSVAMLVVCSVLEWISS